MTRLEMIEVLVDKGYTRKYAEQQATLDWDELNNNPQDGTTEECSVCRRSFTILQMQYHYHPCE